MIQKLTEYFKALTTNVLRQN